MTVDIVTLLRELDFSISEGASSTSWLLRAPDGTFFELEPKRPVARLTAHVVRNLTAHDGIGGRPLFVGESATDGVAMQAKAGQIDILTAEPVQLIHAGAIYRVEEDLALTQVGPAAKRPAWIRWAVERYLLLVREPTRQLAIAAALGTSQQSVSNAAHHLGDLVIDHGNGLIAANRSSLLDHWLREYPGPEGQEFGWYSLDSIAEQTAKAVSLANLLDIKPLVSGDVAADRLAPWKLPTRSRIYVNGPIDLTGDGFVPAPVEESTLITCIPRDPSIWRLTDLPTVTARWDDIKLADAAIVYWDTANSKDIDGQEAARRLASFIVQEKP